MKMNLQQNLACTSACTIRTMTSILSLKLCMGERYGHLYIRRSERIVHDLGFLWPDFACNQGRVLNSDASLENILDRAT